MTHTDSDRLLGTWRELVEIESGSHDRDGLVRMADVMNHHLEELGFEVHKRGASDAKAPHLVANRSVAGSPPVLLLGHLDTVWPAGSLAQNPFRLEGNQLFGPGVADMKGGLAVMLESIRRTRDIPSLRVVLTADEELGSPTGRQLVEDSARGCGLSLVFEAGRPDGGLVEERRGIAVFTLTAHGRTAHAGNDPQNGIDAIEELAHQVLALSAMRDIQNDVYVMAGKIEGGTARQVVPDRAHALIDVRGGSRETLDNAITGVRNLANHTHVPGVRVTVEGGETRPPFEPVPGIEPIKEQIRIIAESLGQEALFVRGGGGSDGNFTAAVGVPTIDGLGPVGHRLCSREESAEWSTGEQRVALVSALLAAMGSSH